MANTERCMIAELNTLRVFDVNFDADGGEWVCITHVTNFPAHVSLFAADGHMLGAATVYDDETDNRYNFVDAAGTTLLLGAIISMYKWNEAHGGEFGPEWNTSEAVMLADVATAQAVSVEVVAEEYTDWVDSLDCFDAEV